MRNCGCGQYIYIDAAWSGEYFAREIERERERQRQRQRKTEAATAVAWGHVKTN